MGGQFFMSPDNKQQPLCHGQVKGLPDGRGQSRPLAQKPPRQTEIEAITNSCPPEGDGLPTPRMPRGERMWRCRIGFVSQKRVCASRHRPVFAKRSHPENGGGDTPG
jgi:hypothetical protein